MKFSLSLPLMLGVFMVNCNKNEDMSQKQPLPQPPLKQEVQTIPATSYTLSEDGKTLSQWKDQAATSIDFSEDKVLNKITTIAQEAFKGNKKITKIVLPTTLTTIGEKAFQGCTELTSVTRPVSITQGKYRGDFFASANKSIPASVEEGLLLPEGVISIGEHAFSYCGKIKKIILPKGVTKILSGTFSHCETLEEVILPEGFTHIDQEAFASCKNLKSINFPNSLTHIGKNAFEETKLSLLILPDSVKNIGELAFSNCIALTSVTLSKSLTSIENNTFLGCTALTSVTIPKGITSIGEGAFAYCIYNHRTTKTNQKYPSVNL